MSKQMSKRTRERMQAATASLYNADEPKGWGWELPDDWPGELPDDWGEWNEAEEQQAFDDWNAAMQRFEQCEAAEHPRRVGKHTTSTANGLTRAIIRHIVANGGQAERINVFGRPITHKEGGREVIERWAASQMTVGTADISATINGRSVKIEVKIGRDQQSEAQRRYQRQIEAAGGIYYIARNLDDFMQWYNATFKAATEEEERG